MRRTQAVGQATIENGPAIRILGTVRDITARNTAEARERLLVRKSNNLLPFSCMRWQRMRRSTVLFRPLMGGLRWHEGGRRCR